MESHKAIKLTKSIIDKINVTEEEDQVFYRDDQLKGFALKVTSNGVKSFIVETRIANKVKHITLGEYGQLTAEEARKQAKHLLV